MKKTNLIYTKKNYTQQDLNYLILHFDCFSYFDYTTLQDNLSENLFFLNEIRSDVNYRTLDFEIQDDFNIRTNQILFIHKKILTYFKNYDIIRKKEEIDEAANMYLNRKIGDFNYSYSYSLIDDSFVFDDDDLINFNNIINLLYDHDKPFFVSNDLLHTLASSPRLTLKEVILNDIV